jgi:hypothetical protein
MSTKIYDAYRVAKKHDLTTIIREMRAHATEALANSKEKLELIHIVAVAYANKEKDNDWRAKQCVDEAIEGKFSHDTLYWIEKLMKESTISMERDMIGATLKASISYDHTYWYFKFFANSPVERLMLNAREKMTEVEDYHYQNQTDPPEGIPYSQFEKRCKKWESLMIDDRYNTMPLETTIFDQCSFTDLTRRYWWQGKTDLYPHLAYKFDTRFYKLKKVNENDNSKKKAAPEKSALTLEDIRYSNIGNFPGTMDADEFTLIFERRVAITRELLITKAKEYANGNTDRLHSFNRGARISGKTPSKVLDGFLLKHYISYQDMLDKIERGEKIALDRFEEKIGDIIVYFFLQEACMLKSGLIQQ